MNLTSSSVSCSLEQDGWRVAEPTSVASVTVAANSVQNMARRMESEKIVSVLQRK